MPFLSNNLDLCKQLYIKVIKSFHIKCKIQFIVSTSSYQLIKCSQVKTLK